ncbi:CoA pyrophosphatase [Leptospira biflexa]|jgi:8-oxo-dGTP pyrophosphatase MutT (NUDIX family)|uniref:Putative hydrolase n=1 Tax=Leptospira biflexa serovar Patoc (strain Patoc 1 / ATCC 23582 / Paris) TaxID=456481 RepID=B0SK73_LEPBP|nr:CoA pyrophosphatase [Leptospira biflexa]ABZ92712.1 NUDIX domain protein [Leptospira biflexa serovar Patoc strain 'Patoc 1 (Ames)']ABZ96316.1 Putative hydrolase [Leptospira biflexa serovar Patoc strain 'Patoc 1 (Paris)']TGM37653.1 CoA pyrophosphatase [Leptospira biflexa]TGM40989.1 CoA pyrophosphatase [Leptospira biflexa]TGM47194.1 CoA pyrophosphatase [Leptospira biflexa]
MLPYQSFVNQLSRDFDAIPDTSETKSGVIFPLFGSKETAEGIILTERAKHLKSHPGQISFPGGVMETSDPNLLVTALREWEEEMGVERTALDILGKLQGLHTRTGFHITPFLAKYDGDFTFSQNKDEVERIILLPFSDLWTRPFYAIQIPGREPNHFAYYFDLPDGLLWGATCEMILRFLKEHSPFDRSPQIVQPNLTKPPYLDPKSL